MEYVIEMLNITKEFPGIKANAEHNADYRYDSARVQCPFPFVYEYPAHEISSPVIA